MSLRSYAARAAFDSLNREVTGRICREWSAVLLRLVRVSLTVRGEVSDFDDGRRYIIMSTHASHHGTRHLRPQVP